MANERVDAIDALGKKDPNAEADRNQMILDHMKAQRELAKLKNAEMARNNIEHGRNLRDVDVDGNKRHATMPTSDGLDVNTGTSKKLDMKHVIGFDFGDAKAKVAGAANTLQQGVHKVAHQVAEAVEEGLEALGLKPDDDADKQPDKTIEKVATKDQGVTHDKVVDDQKKATTGGVANTHFQSDGDEKVSIKEQDKTFEAKSAYSSSFGDNAGAKGAVTSAGGAESGYSGGEQPQKGKK